MKLKYEFTRLLVENFHDCFLFYQNVLGFRASFGTENDTFADFEVGDVSISLFDKGRWLKC